jgi:hypothetical protein
MPLSIKNSGTWKTASKVYVKNAGVWKTVLQAWVKTNGIWARFFVNVNAPNTPTTTAVSFNSFTVAWNAVTFATSYLVDIATSSNFSSGIILSNSSTANTSISRSASSSTTHYIRVRAVASDGTTSGYSPTHTVVTSAPPPPPPPPPPPGFMAR